MALTSKPKIAFVMTVPGALRSFMRNHIAALSEEYAVTVYLNLSTDDCGDIFGGEVRLVHVPLERKIDAVADVKCLALLVRHFRREGFRSVHSLLPKSGLLAMAAALVVGVPVRVHTFTGQVWANKRGLKRRVLRRLDKILGGCCTDVLVDSPSQLAFLKREGVVTRGLVLGEGSIAGVDVERFQPNPAAGRELRETMGIAVDAVVFGFLGRLNHDKGVRDLIDAFARLPVGAGAQLVLVGRDEAGIFDSAQAVYGDLDGRLHRVGYTREPERYYNLFDVYCLPSYREGFGVAVLEAAATGVPALASRIYGVTDAVAEGQTGILHQPGNVGEIHEGLQRFLDDPSLRDRLGDAGRLRARERFSEDFVVSKMVEFYRGTLGE